MSNRFFSEKSLPVLDLVALTETVPDQAHVEPVIGPMFQRLMEICGAAGLNVEQPAYAWYEDGADGLLIGAGLPAANDAVVPAATRVTLEARPRAFATLHLGSLAEITQTWAELRAHVEGLGLTPVGPCREFYMATPRTPDDGWIIELQQPVSA